jgi:hypothetical protein
MRAHTAVLASRNIIIVVLVVFVRATLREVLGTRVPRNSVASGASDNVACEEEVDRLEGDAWEKGGVSF